MVNPKGVVLSLNNFINLEAKNSKRSREEEEEEDDAFELKKN